MTSSYTNQILILGKHTFNSEQKSSNQVKKIYSQTKVLSVELFGSSVKFLRHSLVCIKFCLEQTQITRLNEEELC